MNKEIESPVIKKWKVFSSLPKMFIKEKIIAKRNKITWIILLVIGIKSGLPIEKTEIVASIISSKDPNIKKINGIIFMIDKILYKF